VGTLTVTIGGIEFDNVLYDAAGDVLYLHVGEPRTSVEFDASPEGHHLRWDAHGQLVGITILNARLLLEQDGKIVTLPQMQVEASDLEGILTAA
jgi:YD repeat-containing protein